MRSTLALQISAMLASRAKLRITGDSTYRRLCPAEHKRRGMNGLALQVQEVLRRDPYSGHLFVFRGRRGDLIKILWHDTQGLCLFVKRLERGRFIWPSPAEGVVTITSGQLGYLIDHTW